MPRVNGFQLFGAPSDTHDETVERSDGLAWLAMKPPEHAPRVLPEVIDATS
jgi:hypothetical protein